MPLGPKARQQQLGDRVEEQKGAAKRILRGQVIEERAPGTSSTEIRQRKQEELTTPFRKQLRLPRARTRRRCRQRSWR